VISGEKFFSRFVDLGKEGRAARVGFVRRLRASASCVGFVGKGLGSQWLKEAKVKEKAVAGTAGPGKDSTNYHGTKLVVL
jgi:hypothetical protein